MTIQEPDNRGSSEALTPSDLATIRRSLETEVERLRATLQRGGSTYATQGDAEDNAELSERLDERAYATTLAANLSAIIADCESALRRLDSDDYGRCERCGDAIDRFRLLAFPRASQCLYCKTGR